MKKVLLAVIATLVLLPFPQLASAQAGSSNLDQELIRTAYFGDLARIQQLLEAGANIEAKDEYGKTALMTAAKWGSVGKVRLLLEKGANIEAKDKRGNTALLIAAESGSTDVVRLLLEKGANIEAKGVYERTTALFRAAGEAKTDVVKLLLEKGAELSVVDGSQRLTALSVATNQRKREEQFLGTAPNDTIANNTREKIKRLMEIERLLGEAIAKDPRLQLGEMVSWLQRNPNDNAARERTIALVTTFSTPPAIPPQARELFLQAGALIKQTSTPAELEKPVKLLRDALQIAPWWGNAYYNLSRALELSGQYDEAVTQLNYYLQSKPAEADATEARAHISVIQAAKQTAARKKIENENLLAVKYVSGGATRLRVSEAPAWWTPEKGRGIQALYTYWVAEEAPFYVNAFRMPNNRILLITLNAQVENDRYTGDWIGVWDQTDQACRGGWGDFRFGQQGHTDPCGHRYDVSVTNPPNAMVTVTYASTGASVTIPVALLYRGRAIAGSWPSGGEVLQGGTEVKILQFDESVVNAARDPNANAMGLTPRSVTLYHGK